MADRLFEAGAAEPEIAAEADAGRGVPRLRKPHRTQVEMRCASLDQLLEWNHPARTVWDVVCGVDLGRWLARVKAVEGHVGRDGTDPRVLLALWVYATIDGVGSAREIARLCGKHTAYEWLRGNVPVNHHMLSDFRSQNIDDWDDLLTQIVAALLAEGLVELNRVSQDGMKVRAHAGKSSYRRKRTLEECRRKAREQVETLRRLAEESPQELDARTRAARERAAAERAARIEEALRNCEELQQQRDERAKKACEPAKEARASTTDAEARVMQFSDGGYRPGWNVQFATDESGIIVGVEATNAGNDSEELVPMLSQLHERYGKRPREVLVDGNFTTKAAITEAADRGCTVYGPIKEEQKQRDAGKDPHAKKKGDSPAVAEWRARMGTAAAKALYKLRCRTAEWVNAVCRNHGLWQMPVRGRTKCRGVALLHAITHNLLTAVRLREEKSMPTS